MTTEPEPLSRALIGMAAGEARSWACLVELLGPILRALAVNVLGPEEGEDGYQELLVHLRVQAGRFAIARSGDVEAQARSWVYSVAKRSLLNQLRGHRRRQAGRAFIDVLEDGLESDDLLVVDSEPEAAVTVVQAVLRELSGDDQLLVRERWIEGRSYRQLARDRGCSEGAVRVRGHRALRRLRTLLLRAGYPAGLLILWRSEILAGTIVASLPDDCGRSPLSHDRGRGRPQPRRAFRSTLIMATAALGTVFVLWRAPWSRPAPADGGDVPHVPASELEAVEDPRLAVALFGPEAAILTDEIREVDFGVAAIRTTAVKVRPLSGGDFAPPPLALLEHEDGVVRLAMVMAADDRAAIYLAPQISAQGDHGAWAGRPLRHLGTAPLTEMLAAANASASGSVIDGDVSDLGSRPWGRLIAAEPHPDFAGELRQAVVQLTNHRIRRWNLVVWQGQTWVLLVMGDLSWAQEHGHAVGLMLRASEQAGDWTGLASEGTVTAPIFER